MLRPTKTDYTEFIKFTEKKLSKVYLKYLEVLDDKMVWSEDRVFRVKSFYSEAFIRHQNSIFKLFLEKIVQYNGFTTFGQCSVDGVKVRVGD